MRIRAHRSKRGASTIVLMLFTAIFVILPLGLLGFEFARAFLMQQELRNVTDSAALSGTAAMASAPEYISGVLTTYSQRETIAMNNALQTFQYNSILGTAFTLTNVTANQNPSPPTPQTPSLHNAILNIMLVNNLGVPVPLGTPAATLTVQSFYTECPVFASKILPIQTNFTLTATSNGGLPMLDVILCLDISGSMDDQTPIWLVNRYWDTTSKTVMYNTSVTNSGGVSGQGVLFTVFQPPYTGTSLNVYPPQNLASASYPTPLDNTNPFWWSETPPAGTYTAWSQLNGLRSNATVPSGNSNMPEQGMPPGNCDPTNATTKGTNRLGLVPAKNNGNGGFTDMVCNMGFPITFQGYSFPNVQTAVEASRGNLESPTVLATAMGGSAIPSMLPAPKSGYFNAYWTWVLQNASPIAQARSSAYNFFNTMNISSNCHMGLVCFSSGPGTSPTDVYSGTNLNIDPSYSTGGTGTFPNPMIALNQSNTSATEFTAVTTGIEGSPAANPPSFTAGSGTYPVSAEGATDIADALTTALNQLIDTTKYRSGAKRAIVLFTDGVPNIPTSGATTAALNVATTAGGDGIPIYTIGLSQNPSIQSQEDALLNSSTNGIAFKSGNNAIYVPVTNASQLDQAFQTIARSLCVIQ